MTMRIIERYEDGLRIEAGFYDDANAGAGLPPLSRTERAVLTLGALAAFGTLVFIGGLVVLALL